MNMTMTLREALEIQARQVSHYHNANLPAMVAAATNTEGRDLDTPMPIHEVNELVPRGADIEFMLCLDARED